MLNRRITLIVAAFPQRSETFIVSKFLGLIGHGYVVRIVCGKFLSSYWTLFPKLHESKNIRSKMLTGYTTNPKFIIAFLYPYVFLRTFIAAPALTYRYIQRGWSKFRMRLIRQFYLDARIIQSKPDVIHFEFGALAAGHMYLGDLLDCRVTVSFRGYDINFSGLDQPDYYDDVWQGADLLHFLGNDLRDRAIRRGLPRNKPYMLIPPAIDVKKFIPENTKELDVLGTPERPIRILSVGRLAWKKGYEYALSAIKILINQGLCVEYQIIGGGDYLEPLAFTRYDLHIEECVTFVGSVPPESIPIYMRQADILLHAAVSEGFCNAVIEAQAMQLPVVTTDADGLPENVEDQITGFIVPRRDAEALAEKVALLASDPILRARMGQAGRKRVEECFTIQAQAKAFAEFYDRVLESK